MLYLEAMGPGWKNCIKLSLADISRSFWVSTIEVCHKVRCRNFRGGLLEVIFMTISLLLDEVLELSLMLVTVEDLFHFPLLFSINEYRQRMYF